MKGMTTTSKKFRTGKHKGDESYENRKLRKEKRNILRSHRNNILELIDKMKLESDLDSE